MPEQSVFFGGKQSSGLTNTLLVLNLVGIVVIIILLLWWWPWYWGHGRAAVVGGTATPGPGGNIIIDTCCDGGRTPDCPNGGKKTCEEECKESTGGNQAAYDKCVQSRCKPPTTQTCQDTCNNRYGAGTTAADACIRDECCEDSCKQRYGSTNYYSECVRTECGTPPPTETCEDYCKTVYGSPGMENYYQQCLRERCNGKTTSSTTTTTVPDCRDSDGYNLGTAGKVVSGDQTYSDTCYSATEVTEYTCDGDEVKMRREPCQGKCEYGRCVPGTTTTTSNDPCREYCEQAYATSGASMIDQCVQQHWCPV